MSRFFSCCLALSLGLLPCARGQVVINEMASASNERQIRWTAAGVPHLGSGIKWNENTFPETGWLSGPMPAGWGSTVGTNLQTAMLNKTPSVYLRKSFNVTAGQAASANPVILQVEYNDGFVAYLNGVEVARYNCGAPGHFMYAAQPAYNAATTTGLTEITLGNANTLLLTGTNVLSIEARNADFGSTLRVNAGLKLITSTAPVALTNALYNHNSATGATKTHTNTAGAITNTSAGVPQVGGWLAAAANPASDNLWTSLEIITGEVAGAGVGGSGGLRYSVTQTGTNRTASVRAPQVTMTNAWAPGGVTPEALAATTVRFRFRTTGDLQFGFRGLPGLTQAANSVDGFPTVGAPFGGTADYDWSTASGGYFGTVINASGGQSTTLSGSINIANYEQIIGPGCRSGEVRAREDNTAGAGPGGTTGVFSWTYLTFPTVIDTLGFGIKALKVPEWVAGAISAADFQQTRLSFRWKMPAGRTQSFYLESTNGGTAAERANLGTFTGTGNWETYAATLSDIPNSAALRTKLNSAGKDTKLTGYWAGVNFSNGESVQIDTLNIYKEAAGSPVDENTALSFGNAAGGTVTRTITAGGSVSDATTGTPVSGVTLTSDPGATGFVFRAVEDNTAAAGNGGSTGFLRCEVTDAPDTGAPWGLILPGVKVRNWTTGAITVPQLGDVSVQFAAKLPAGVTFTVYAEPTGGSTANRANLGTLTGNGTWQSVTREFATAANVENFRTALNTAGTTTFQLTFIGPVAATVGTLLSLDDVQIVPWRTYQVTLSQGANQQRFMDQLNSGSTIAFVPEFVKNTAAPAGGGTFSIDDFEVSYAGPDPNAFQTLVGLGGAGGNWKYFVGIAEPSGGLFDPVLAASGFPTPPGEEEEYDNPQNFRDWIELRNLGGSAVNLTGWTLTDEQDTPAKWTFPAGTTIAANGYLLVMCDDREETNGTATYLHASFSLSATGEYVALYNNSAQLQSAVTNVPDQDTFHTWGRQPGGGASYGFLDTGTPGAANVGNFTSARVKTPDFFKADGVTPLPGGFYTGTQTLVLKSETVGATIRYTTDGSEPTETTGTLYSGPISVTAVGDGKSGRVYRARAFLAGLVSSNAKVHTYLIDLHANLKGVPALLFTGDAGRNFYLPHGIMAINGGPASYDTWTPSGPTSYNIPINRGDSYERFITAEWYKPDGTDGWRDDVGIRVSSSPYSRPRLKLDQTANSPWVSDHTEKPSFNLYWRDDYGNSKLSYNGLIPQNDVNNYKQLRIRAGKNDILNPFLIDEVARRLFRDMGWVQPTGTINTAYVNGSFKGMFNTTERLRAPMFQEHYHTDNDFDVRYIGEQVDGDVTFWNSMQAALNTLNTTPSLANYNNVQAFLDATNVADYFLHNIYVNNNDWPNNNWAAHRERVADGRYRMVEWDVEGAFGRFGQAVNYNTIDDKLLNTSTECGDIFKRLYQSAEFKLLMADRINKHMWNGGVLDDRGSSDRFQQLVNQFTTLVQPLQTYLGAGTIDLTWYNNHINATTGRRAYLFGTGAGNFRSKGLWPVTEPPTFSQFGGVVPGGYQLIITSPTGGTIYYTLNGSDPRLPGGAIAATALTYTGPITLNSLTTVRARVRSAGGEWSPIIEAYFEPNAQQPTATSLVVSEFLYNPPAETAAESAAGWTNSDDFEFIRLTNIAAFPLDLRNLRFTLGITYDFSLGTVLAINSGASVLVVKNRDAFRARYGTSYDGMITGEFTGSLNNAGEQLTLATVGGSATTIANFTYSDTGLWPKAADGYGPSLMLIAPTTPAPNPNLPASWTTSAQPGGTPGGTPRTLTYAAWKQLCFDIGDAADPLISGPLADPDGDGLSNRAEYGLGAVPRFADATAHTPVTTLELFAGKYYLHLQYHLQAGASEATCTPEVSANLTAWGGGVANLSGLIGPVSSPAGYISWKVRDNTATDAATRRFIHLGITTP